MDVSYLLLKADGIGWVGVVGMISKKRGVYKYRWTDLMDAACVHCIHRTEWAVTIMSSWMYLTDAYGHVFDKDRVSWNSNCFTECRIKNWRSKSEHPLASYHASQNQGPCGFHMKANHTGQIY